MSNSLLNSYALEKKKKFTLFFFNWEGIENIL